MTSMDGGEWQVAGRRKARRRAPRASPGRPKLPTGEFRRAEEVGDERRLAVQARVRGLADALRVTPLAQQAAGAVRAHFRLQEGESAEKAELQVVGYGIGSFCASGNAALQLALLVALLEELRPAAASQAEVFDPVMSESDALVAEHFGVGVIEANESGRRRASGRAVFFMPHCGKSLYENVVAANWGVSITDILIIGNSFEAYGDRVMGASEREQLLLRALPFVRDQRLPIGVDRGHEDFSRFEAAFNDLSVVTFTDVDALVEDRELAERMAAAVSGGGERDEIISA